MKYDFAFGWDTPYGHAVRLVEAHAPTGGLVLDLGCGAAAIAEPLAELGFGYLGVDVDEEAVDHVQRRGIAASSLDLAGAKAVDELRDLLGDTPLAAVTALDVVEHLADPEQFLRTLHELLAPNPGAVLVTSIPNVAHRDLGAKLVAGRWDVTPTGLLDATHISLFTDERLRRVTTAVGFVETARYDFVLARSDQHFPSDHPALAPGAPLAQLLREVRGLVDPYAEVNQFIRAYTVGEPSAPSDVAAADDEHEGPAGSPFLSVLVHTGRRHEVLGETLTCLAAQSDPDLEVVLLAADDDRRDLADVERVVGSFEPSFAARVRFHHLPGATRSELLRAGLDLVRGAYVSVLDAGDMVTAQWCAAFRRAAHTVPGSVARSAAVDQDVRPAGTPDEVADVFTLSGFRASHPARFAVTDHLEVNATPPGSFALPMTAVRAFPPLLAPPADDGEPCEEATDWLLFLRTALWAGVFDTAEPTTVRRCWTDEPSDTSAWLRARRAVLDQLDAAPMLLPRGSAAALAGPEPTWDWRAQLARVRQLEARLGAAMASADAAEQARQEAHVAAEAARDEMAGLRTELDRVRTEADERHARLLAEHTTVMEQRRLLAEAVEAAREEAAEAKHALRLHQESRWWKLTAPARRLVTFLRR